MATTTESNSVPLDHRLVSRLGGIATKKKYGKSHFKTLARKRWDSPESIRTKPKRKRAKSKPI